MFESCSSYSLANYFFNELRPVSCSKWSQFRNWWFLKEWNLVPLLCFIAFTKLNLTRKCTGIYLTASKALETLTYILYLESLLQSTCVPDPLSWWYLCIHNVCALNSLFLPKGDYSFHCCEQPHIVQQQWLKNISWSLFLGIQLLRGIVKAGFLASLPAEHSLREF